MSSSKTALITGVTGQDGAFSGRAPARKGLHRPRHQATLFLVQHRAHRSSLSGSARRRRPLLPPLRRSHRHVEPHPHHPGIPADGNLQSRRAEPCPGMLRNSRIHRQRRRLGTLAAARGHPYSEARRPHAVLSGLDVGALRPGAGGSATRDDAVLSSLPLRRGETLRLLDHRELPRGLWHCTPRTEFCSIMRARCAAKPS